MGTTATYEANHPIPLGELHIEFVIDGRLLCVSAKAVQKLSPTPHVVVEVSNVPREPQGTVIKPASGQRATMTRSAPILSEGPSTIKLGNGTEVKVVPTSWLFGQRDATLHLEQSPCVVLETDTPIQFMQFVVLNFSWSGPKYRWILQASPWSVNIEPVPNISELEKTLRTNSGYAATHQGIIRRLDGKEFPVEEATDLLDGLDQFLSFVCGAHCSLANVIGIDIDGNEAWKRWGSYGVSPWGKHHSWFDITIIGALRDIFPAFWNEFKRRKPSLSRVLRLYVESNVSKSIDVSIILTQVALEILSDGQEQRMGDVLSKAEIPTKIPPGLKELEELRIQMDWHNGPHTIVELRNSLTHAKSKHSNASIDAYYQAKQLGLWYVELLLLKLFGYTGRHASRLTPVQRPGDTELVPWAKGAEIER